MTLRHHAGGDLGGDASGDSNEETPPGLWRDGDFRRLWVGQTVSQLGEQACLVVLPLIAVLALHADAGRLGVLRAVGQVPILLFSLLAGAWVDSRSTRTVMVLADLGRALVLGGAAVVGLLAGFGLPLLLVAGFAVGTLSVFFDVSYQASLVRLVTRNQLVQGNGLLEGSRSAAQIGGPALGGLLVSLLAPSVAVVSGALFFTVSFLSIHRIRREESPPADLKRTPQLRTPQLRTSQLRTPGLRTPVLQRRIHEGLQMVAASTALRSVAISSAVFQFSFAAMMTVYLVFLTRDLHLTGAAVGLALAATGPGAVLGSLLAGRLPGRVGHGVLLVVAAVLGDVALLCVPALHRSAVSLPVLVGLNFVYGVCGQLVNVTVMAVRQAVTPDGMQGRAAATITFVGMGLTPLGSLLGGFLGQEWGLRTGLVVTAAAMLLSPVVMVLSPLARLGRVLPTVAQSVQPSRG